MLELLALSDLGGSPVAREALGRAEHVATTKSGDDTRRADAVGLLALDRATDRTALLQALVDPREPETVQSAAIKALGQRPGTNHRHIPAGEVAATDTCGSIRRRRSPARG